MPIYKDFKTIPQLFQIITQDFGRGKERPVLKYKANDQWFGIKYDEVYRDTENLALGLAALGVKRKIVFQ